MKHEPLKITAYSLVTDTDTLVRSVIGRVSAGLPIEIVGEEEDIDFNYLLRHGSSNAIAVRVHGKSMCPEIADGDWVVICRDRVPRTGDIVIAEIAGGCTIKRLQINNVNSHRHGLRLVASNTAVATREVSRHDDFRILGVVTSIIHRTIP